MASQEEWKRVPRYPDYEVSSFGRVRSCQREVHIPAHTDAAGRSYPDQVRVYKSRMLSPHLDQGRPQLHLSNGPIERVHVLVLEAFVGPMPDDCQCCRHLDGNPANNNLENLKWGLDTENMDDARRHGTLAQGETNGRSTLKESDVRLIRELNKAGSDWDILAERFHTTACNISLICRGKRWKHLLNEEAVPSGTLE